MNKQEFINEIASRGTIDIAKLPTDFSEREWWIFQVTLMYVDLPYGIIIRNIYQHNPPTEILDITFQERNEDVDSLPDDYLIARIGELPLVMLPVTCDEFTANYSSGCELLLHYDEDYDGVINLDELNQSYTDYENGIITEVEFDFVSDAYINGGINVVCPGCYVEPMPAVRHVAEPIDEKTKTPITGAKVYICEEAIPFDPSSPDIGHCTPGTFVGAPPLDITFCLACDYKLGIGYTVVVRAEGYISGNIRRAYAPGEDITFSLVLCSCIGPTTHYSSGLDLLKHYDPDSDGVITKGDVIDAISDCIENLITRYEVWAVMEVLVNGGSIDAMCLGKKTVTFESVPSGANVILL